MKSNKLFSIMDLAKRARENGDIFNPMFVSPPGIGKTEMIEQWCVKNDYQYIPFSLATSDAPDFKGFPNIQVINGRQRMSFALPDFWPTEGHGVIVLEELNRTTSATMQCVLSLGDKRRGFDGYKLPPGWLIVSCVNPEDGYDTTAMDHALKDRFEIFNVSFDKEAFVNYMKLSAWDKELVQFVESGLWSYKTPEEVGNAPGAKYTSSRTLSKLNAARKAVIDKDDELDVFETILGRLVAKDFYNFLYNESPVMMSDLKRALKGSLKKLTKFSDPNNYKNGMISLTVRDIIEDNTISDEMLAEVVMVIPVEQGSVLIREIEFKRKDDAILQRLCKMKPEMKELFKSVVKYNK
jgi:MoxR-like ATPase